MSSDAVTTVAGLFDEATAALKAAGVVKPRREANRLYAWLNRTSPGDVYLSRDQGAGSRIAATFRAAVARRAAGEPLAHVLGFAGFRNLELRSDHRALIPRPETEGLIDLALARVRTGRALDLCTGSGCLALALAQEGGFDEVIGTDIAPDALELARENARLTGLPVGFLLSDLGAALDGEGFDLVVTNPPYLTDAEYGALDASVKAWEPRLALASGPDGLDVTRRIFKQGRDLLRSDGWIVMELDFSRSHAAAELAAAVGLINVNVWDDLYGRPRYLTARRETER